jgi:Na+-driven multidrug efflux pump
MAGREGLVMTAFPLIGAVCIALGLGVTWWAGGYQGSNEYKNRRYIIETLFCFGLLIFAWFLVSQGAILMIFGDWIL